MRFRLLGFILLFILCSARPPQLTPRDTRIKIEEILKAHVSYHELTQDLISRAFQNYLEELDPGKTYLLENEITKWISPSPELLKEALVGIQKENFIFFEEIHQTIVPAIERRGLIEKEILNTPLLKGINPLDFKEIGWANSEEELKRRILSIRSLQIDAAEKLDQTIKEQFMQRLEKRRLKREEELVTESPKERQKLSLALTLKAISNALDSQTAYFTPSEANQFMIQVQQRLFGIGAQLRDDLNGFTIVRILEGGPAQVGNKLKVNDRIIAVDHEPVVGMDIVEAVELIRGPKGHTVTLTVLRDMGEEKEKREEKIDIKIIRGEVILTETRIEKSYEPFGDGVIGILHLHSFYQDSQTSSTQDLKEAIEALKKEHHLKGIILDLRGNAGGLLPQAVSVSGLFIKKGIVVSIKDNTGQIQHLRNIESNTVWDGPLVVLTNRTSASAAEIVAQSLQDYGRAIVVGDPTTYGKGTFQTFTLESANYGKVNPKGEYKVTRGRYYTVSGKSPQLVGVKPDIEVPGLYSQLEIGEKFSKFPLENEEIPPNFEDDLSDVPLSHRPQIARMYKFNLQPILSTYTQYLPMLAKNSQLRIAQNKNYQLFLKELDTKDSLSETAESYGLSDLQMTEASNILKDLILLMHEDQDRLIGTSPAA